MNVFDIIGPVMIGPSSSHTAGAVRLGRVAYKLLGTEAVSARIELTGSFAQTYRGHGTDKALVAGIMGMDSDDERIRRSLELAAEAGMEVAFVETNIPNAHPNTARITLTGRHGESAVVQGASVGGGSILITAINGMSVSFTGQYNTILVRHLDKPGAIAAVTQFMAGSGMNQLPPLARTPRRRSADDHRGGRRRVGRRDGRAQRAGAGSKGSAYTRNVR